MMALQRRKLEGGGGGTKGGDAGRSLRRVGRLGAEHRGAGEAAVAAGHNCFCFVVNPFGREIRDLISLFLLQFSPLAIRI
jgi:hypothetical protein